MIHSIAKTAEGFATGGKDGKIKLWSEELRPLLQFSVYAEDKEMLNARNAPIRSMSAPNDHTLLYSTQGCDIFVSNNNGEQKRDVMRVCSFNYLKVKFTRTPHYYKFFFW